MPTTPEHTASGATIIFDTTVLSNFARSGQFQWLERLYADRGSTTVMVIEEIYRGIEAGYSDRQSVAGQQGGLRHGLAVDQRPVP